MSLFAEIDSNNIVQRVVVVEDGCDADWCRDFFEGGTWIETFQDGSSRKNYAGIGHTYDSTADAFYEPKPFASWSLDTDTYQWKPPVPHPNNGTPVSWDESSRSWVSI